MFFRKVAFPILLVVLAIVITVLLHQIPLPLSSSRALAQTPEQVQQRTPESLVAEADEAYQQGDYTAAESLFVQAADLYCAHSGIHQGNNSFNRGAPSLIVRHCESESRSRWILHRTLLRDQVIDQLIFDTSFYRSEPIQIYNLPLQMADVFRKLGDISQTKYKNYSTALYCYKLSADIFRYKAFLDQFREEIDTPDESLPDLLSGSYELGISLFNISSYFQDDTQKIEILTESEEVLRMAVNKLPIFTYNPVTISFGYTSSSRSERAIVSTSFGVARFVSCTHNETISSPSDVPIIDPRLPLRRCPSAIEERATQELLSLLRSRLLRSNTQFVANLPSEMANDLTALLQRVLVQKYKLGDEASLSKAFLISDAGRTLEVDKSVAYNLAYADRENDLKLLRDLSLRLNLDTIKEVINEDKLTLVNYSIALDKKLFIWVFRPNSDGLILHEVNCDEVLDQPTENLSESHSQSQCSSKLMSLIQTWSRSSYIDRGEYIAKTEIEEVERNGQGEGVFYTDEELQKLHQLLIEPIADLLPDDPNQPIVFVPHGPLFFVPFAALMNKDGKYLIESHTIGTVPNLRTLILNHENHRRRPSREQSAVVVGNPTMPSAEFLNEDGLPPLPWADLEAVEVNNLLSKQRINVTQLIGEQATEEAVAQMMDQASIVHLATHAIIDSSSSDTVDSQEVSGQIALAPSGTASSDENDGWLTALDLLKMRLDKTDLVVLSACDTARGQLIPGGVVGLPFSLSLAGVRSIVASLWAVPDTEATVFLMKDFYSQILNSEGEVNLARALRQAMLHTKDFEGTILQNPEDRTPYSNPRYWAGFTLIGSTQQ